MLLISAGWVQIGVAEATVRLCCRFLLYGMVADESCSAQEKIKLPIIESSRRGSVLAVAPSDVAKGREHPGVEVVEQMAMDCPKPGGVGVEGDHDPAPRRHQHGVAHRAGKALAVDFDHLKFMPVQVHRMRHRRLVDEDEFDPFARCKR